MESNWIFFQNFTNGRGYFRLNQIPKILDLELWLHLSMDQSDIWYWGSFLLGLHGKFAIAAAAQKR